MRKLFTMDMQNYDPNWKRFRRPSVRGIIRKNAEIAMVYSPKYDYYKFPGGGLEPGEEPARALMREVHEETGMQIIPASIREYGAVLRIQNSTFCENTIFEQENFYYFCDAKEDLDMQKLDDYESEEGFTLRYVTPDHARIVNRTHDHNGCDAVMIEREARVLEMLETETE